MSNDNAINLNFTLNQSGYGTLYDKHGNPTPVRLRLIERDESKKTVTFRLYQVDPVHMKFPRTMLVALAEEASSVQDDNEPQRRPAWRKTGLIPMPPQLRTDLDLALRTRKIKQRDAALLMGMPVRVISNIMCRPDKKVLQWDVNAITAFLKAYPPVAGGATS